MAQCLTCWSKMSHGYDENISQGPGGAAGIIVYTIYCSVPIHKVSG